MEAIKITATASEGRLTVAVPEAFNNQELEVIVLRKPKEDRDERQEAMTALHRKRMELFGKAKYPDFPISKYDVYNQ
jgi:hypothetical protein